jgi:hypothetical protein
VRKLSFKHGFFGALFLMFLGALALEYLKQFSSIIFGIFGKIGAGVSDFLLEKASIIIHPKVAEIIVFILALSMLWLLGQMAIKRRSRRD